MPYLSDEQRKAPLEHMAGYFLFKCEHLDLSAPVHVEPVNKFYQFNRKQIASSVAEFTAWWMLNVHRDLNGFSGIDTVKWVFA